MKAFVSSARGREPRPRFRELLQAELSARCGRNEHYSLRAFALDLGTDHSTLSQLLRGKRAFTATTIERFGERLKLDEATLREYVELERCAPRGDTAQAGEIRMLAHDAAAVIGDWYHHAILELVRLENFRADSRWIARVLGITVDEVNIALQRLLRLGLLEMASDGRWLDRSGDHAVDLEHFERAAVEKLSAQVRRLAFESLADTPSEMRAHSSTTIAINTERVPEVIERIARFRAELLAWLERDARRDDVFQLEISFFPLTTFKRGE